MFRGIGMSPKRHIYTLAELAIVVPTKNRPDNVRKLLESLSTQSCKPGQVILVDGGNSIEQVVMAFDRTIPVEYYVCRPPGQIRQRELGLGKLGTQIRLVAFLDDKIMLAPDALEMMLACWNRVESETAGIGFNITNVSQPAYSRCYKYFFVRSTPPGKVSLSGSNAIFPNLTEDLRTEWLGGGYTVWRKEILDMYPQREVDTRWAAGEDLRFSYPIGREYPLWACCSAKCQNVTVLDQASDENVLLYRSRAIACHELYFAYTQQGINFLACLWMVSGLIVIDALCGWRYSNNQQLLAAHGRLQGLFRFLRVLFSQKDNATVLNDK